eukprot:COSAG06_NODE_48102_length_334_cov_1.106383_1_plen_24_part_01
MGRDDTEAKARLIFEKFDRDKDGL